MKQSPFISPLSLLVITLSPLLLAPQRLNIQLVPNEA